MRLDPHGPGWPKPWPPTPMIDPRSAVKLTEDQTPPASARRTLLDRLRQLRAASRAAADALIEHFDREFDAFMRILRRLTGR